LRANRNARPGLGRGEGGDRQEDLARHLRAAGVGAGGQAQIVAGDGAAGVCGVIAADGVSVVLDEHVLCGLGSRALIFSGRTW